MGQQPDRAGRAETQILFHPIQNHFFHGAGVVTDVIGAAKADDITPLQRPQRVKLEQFRNLVEIEVQVVNLVAEAISLGREAVMLHMADVDGTLEFCISRHR